MGCYSSVHYHSESKISELTPHSTKVVIADVQRKYILCVGDSLTAGYSRAGYTPFGDYVSIGDSDKCACDQQPNDVRVQRVKSLGGGERIDDYFVSPIISMSTDDTDDSTVTVDLKRDMMLCDVMDVKVLGMCGFTTSDFIAHLDDIECYDMFQRKECGLRQYLVSQPNFEMIVFMLGTQDILSSFPDESTIENLHILLSICQQFTKRLVIVSVPASGQEHENQEVKLSRININQALFQYAVDHPDDSFYVDINAILPNKGPYHDHDADSASTCGGEDDEFDDLPLWDTDYVHLSPEGSKKLGFYLTECLVQKYPEFTKI